MLIEKRGMARRRLIIRPGAIGDFIVSLPALEHLRAPFTEVWTTEANLPLVRLADAKRSIVSAGLDRLGLLPSRDVMQRLRLFDSIISWYGTGRPEFRELVAGLPFEFLPALPPEGRGVHAVDYYCGQVGALLNAIPRIDVGPVERHGKLVVHPFASHADKRWPGAAYFSPQGFDVVKIRGPEERLAGAIHIPDLFDLARFLAGACAFVGNDSGITHLAAAVGIPTVALFGPTDPAIWAPRGRSVRVIHGATMAEITPEAVIEVLRDMSLLP
jgi:hypothetical protein